MNAEAPPEKPTKGESNAEAEQRIRQRAHLLWEAEGAQPGRADEYWNGLAN